MSAMCVFLVLGYLYIGIVWAMLYVLGPRSLAALQWCEWMYQLDRLVQPDRLTYMLYGYGLAAFVAGAMWYMDATVLLQIWSVSCVAALVLDLSTYQLLRRQLFALHMRYVQRHPAVANKTVGEWMQG